MLISTFTRFRSPNMSFLAPKIKLKRVCGLALASFVRFTQLPMNVFVINIKISHATLQSISGLENK